MAVADISLVFIFIAHGIAFSLLISTLFIRAAESAPHCNTLSIVVYMLFCMNPLRPLNSNLSLLTPLQIYSAFERCE
jgi:hypothetical protein